MDGTREKAEVMLAFARGERIQFRAPGGAWCGWELPHDEPTWDWATVEYRVEPRGVVVRVKTWNSGSGFLEVRPHGSEPYGPYVVIGDDALVLVEDLVRAVRRCSVCEAEKVEGLEACLRG